MPIAAILLFLPFTDHAQSSVQISQARAATGALNLQWTGDSELYEVQMATNLVAGDWRAFLRTNTSCRRVSISGPASFFRVVTLPDWASRIVSHDRRLAVLKVVSQELKSLPRTNLVADAQILLQFLSTIPELEGAQATADHSVSAYFTDGRPLVIVNNRRGATAANWHRNILSVIQPPCNRSIDFPLPKPSRPRPRRSAHPAPVPNTNRHSRVPSCRVVSSDRPWTGCADVAKLADAISKSRFQHFRRRSEFRESARGPGFWS